MQYEIRTRGSSATLGRAPRSALTLMYVRMKPTIKFALCLPLMLLVQILVQAQRPELVVQTGHARNVNCVAFSPDGKLLASGSVDYTVKLWDVATGTELRAFKGHGEVVESVAFGPDGKLVASSDRNGAIKLWDVVTGTELRQFGHAAQALDREDSDGVNSVVFSPDGKLLASGGSDKVLRIWEVATGKELRSLKGHTETIDAVAFSPDGTALASGSSEGVRLWDVASGAGLRELRDAPSGYRSSGSVAFSPDGKMLATASKTVNLWDLSTGQKLRSFSGYGPVAFSPDSKLLASLSDSTTIRLSDVVAGSELRSLKGASTVNSVAFDPAGSFLAGGGWDGIISLWDVSTGREPRTLRGSSTPITSSALSPDGRILASGRDDGNIVLWDVEGHKGLRALTGHEEMAFSLAFSPDGKMLAVGYIWGDTIDLWDVATGKELRIFEDAGGSAPWVAFSPDGRTLAITTDSGVINFWDVATGKKLRTLKAGSGVVDAVVFSPDGKWLASGSNEDGTIELWDIAKSTTLHTFKGFSLTGRSFAFSPDGKMFASSDNGVIGLRNVVSGAEVRALKGHSGVVVSIAFSPDGKWLASKGADHTIRLWDVATGAQARTLRENSDLPISLQFSPDGKRLVSCSYDVNIKLWDVVSGQELGSLIALDNNDWIVSTPDGLFDGSPAAWGKIIWRFNNDTFSYAPVEAFFSDFYYPGLLTDISAGQSPRAPSDISKKDRRQPQLKLSLGGTEHGAVIATRDVEVKVEVAESPAGARDVRLFRNGALVKLWEGDVLKGRRSATLTATVSLLAGENRLAAYAFNNDNIKSGDATLTVTGSDTLKRKGTAYVLAVGVNQYANPSYDLSYSVADARAFGAEVARQQPITDRYERVEVVTLLDREATKANVLSALKSLNRDKVESRPRGAPPQLGKLKPAQPEDAVFIYFAGHGAAARQRFYLVPHDLGYNGARDRLDAAAVQTILSHSISDVEIEQAVRDIDAGQFLLVIDACNSGQALEAEEKRRGPMNSKGLAQLAYEKGMYILTAAQSYQQALESSRLGHGYLTYALVEEGLKTAKADDVPTDGLVTVREWLDFAAQRVPRMQEEKPSSTSQYQKRRQRGKRLLTQEATQERVLERRLLQQPRVFYRREVESQPLIVAKPIH
jgi:WD40 repeat protein/uncharacterized caspase-like protein